MNKLEFKPEDFKANKVISVGGCYELTLNSAESRAIADVANRIFQDWLAQNSERVYGNIARYGFPNSFSKAQLDGNTHTGLLVCIEEIKKKCEEHEPIMVSWLESPFGLPECKCKHCGVDLIARWEAKDETND